MDYVAIVTVEADAAYGVYFPDLPGCFSASDTYEDIRALAIEALALYARDETSLPAPTTYGELIKRPDVQQELRSGSMLMTVPLIVSARKDRYNVMLDPNLVASLDEIAAVRGTSRSEIIEGALKQSLFHQAAWTSGRGVAIKSETDGMRPGTKAASAAARVMKDPTASKDAKKAAASALTQKSSSEKTSKGAASAAAKVLKDKTASKDAKSAAASALTQKKK